MASSPIVRRHRSEAFEHTIAGLLTKRSDLAAEAAELRDRLAALKSDVAAVDRVLAILDYQGNPAVAMPSPKRKGAARSGRMSRRIADALREAGRPMATAEVVSAVLAMTGSGEASEGHPRRIPKGLWRMARAGRLARSRNDDGQVVWRMA